MKLNELRNLAIKLFGLYCITRFIILLPQLVSIFLMTGNSVYMQNKALLALAITISPALYLCLGAVCLFKTRLVVALLWAGDQSSAEKPAAGSGPSSLSFWITLIGFYYLISSFAGLVSLLWVSAVERQTIGSTFLSTKFLPDMFLLPLSIFSIHNARGIDEFIKKMQSTQRTTDQHSVE